MRISRIENYGRGDLSDYQVGSEIRQLRCGKEDEIALSSLPVPCRAEPPLRQASTAKIPQASSRLALQEPDTRRARTGPGGLKAEGQRLEGPLPTGEVTHLWPLPRERHQ